MSRSTSIDRESWFLSDACILRTTIEILNDSQFLRARIIGVQFFEFHAEKWREIVLSLLDDCISRKCALRLEHVHAVQGDRGGSVTRAPELNDAFEQRVALPP